MLRSITFLSVLCVAACATVEPSYEDRAAAYLTPDERAVVGCYQSSPVADRAGATLVPTRMALSPLLRDVEHPLGARQVRSDEPIPQLRVGGWTSRGSRRLCHVGCDAIDASCRGVGHGFGRAVERLGGARRRRSSAADRHAGQNLESRVSGRVQRRRKSVTSTLVPWVSGVTTSCVVFHSQSYSVVPEVFRGLRVTTEGVAALDWEGSSRRDRARPNQSAPAIHGAARQRTGGLPLCQGDRRVSTDAG